MQKHIGTLFKNACTLSARNEIRRKHGVKYSILLDLTYFDIVRYHVIDPMHNIFLGLPKHTMKTWKDLNNCDRLCVNRSYRAKVNFEKNEEEPKEITLGSKRLFYIAMIMNVYTIVWYLQKAS